MFQNPNGGATAVLMHKGLIRYSYRSSGHDIGLIMHLSASTDLGVTSNSKVLVATVEEAIKAGADAVSVHLNVGAETEGEMLADIGRIAKECNDWGMPLLVMAYARGPKIQNSYDPVAVAHAARVATELGADIVKCSYTGDPDSFREVVKGALAPIVIAGGSITPHLVRFRKLFPKLPLKRTVKNSIQRLYSKPH